VRLKMAEFSIFVSYIVVGFFVCFIRSSIIKEDNCLAQFWVTIGWPIYLVSMEIYLIVHIVIWIMNKILKKGE
jgi:hypothetical protein